jgi:ABC-type proline/glycine betaine transport system permease subunit
VWSCHRTILANLGADRLQLGVSRLRSPLALVVTGTLFAAGALLSIVAVIPLGINAARTIDIHVMVKPLTLDNGKTIAAITIFAGTYLIIAIGKLPG